MSTQRWPWPDCVLHERIGEGGIADVFRATLRGREVALKVLRDGDSPGLRARFLREGELLQRLDHPGIVRCHEVFATDPPALALELLRGEGLDARLDARGTIAPQEAVHLASTLLRTLAHLHAQGIVHRDIKPGNVFLTEGNRTVLIDLGLAADAEDPHGITLGEVIGTWAYMAPEQVAGAETDHRVDLYALGVTLYHALSGTLPYTASGIAGWLEAHRRGGAPPLQQRARSAPPRLATLVDRLMARNPVARPSTATVALAELTGRPDARPALREPPLLGREGVRGAILAALHTAGTLTVTGELGSGLGEVARLARTVASEERRACFTLRCRRRTERVALREALLRELGVPVGADGPSHADDDHAVRAALAAKARGTGALLVIEDADVAPSDTQRWIRGLAGVPGVAVIVTATGGVSFGERRVEARPLTVAEVGTLVAHMLGTPSRPPGLEAALHAASGGMPGLAVALLREQAARGACRPDGIGEDGLPRWAWDRAAALVPGEDASRAFLRAMEQLPHATRRLVQVAALAGEPMPLAVLLHAAGAGLPDLRPAQDGGVLTFEQRGDEPWVSMRRAVTEALVLHGVDAAERPRIHAALARAAETRPRAAWEARFIAIQDARASPDPVRLEHLVDVGEWLLAQGRPDDALAALAAHTLGRDANVAVAARGAIARADALRVLGRYAEARAALHAGHALAAGDEARLDDAALVGAQLQLDAGAPLDGETRAWVSAVASRGERRAMTIVAEILLREGNPQGAIAWADAVTAGGTVLDAHGAEAALVRLRAGVRTGSDPHGVAEEARRVADMLAATGDHRRAVDALCVGVEADMARGALARATTGLGAAQRRLADAPMPWRVGRVAIWEAALRAAVGAHTDAEALLRTHAACGDASAPWSVAREWLLVYTRLRLAVADAPSALAALNRASEAARRAGDTAMAALHGGLAAAMATKVDDVTEAITCLRSIGDTRGLALLLIHAGTIGRDPELLQAAVDTARGTGDLVLLRDALRAAGARDEARRVAATLARDLPAPLATLLERTPAT